MKQQSRRLIICAALDHMWRREGKSRRTWVKCWVGEFAGGEFRHLDVAPAQPLATSKIMQGKPG